MPSFFSLGGRVWGNPRAGMGRGGAESPGLAGPLHASPLRPQGWPTRPSQPPLDSSRPNPKSPPAWPQTPVPGPSPAAPVPTLLHWPQRASSGTGLRAFARAAPAPFPVPTLPPSPPQVSAVCLTPVHSHPPAPAPPTSLSAPFLGGAVPPTTPSILWFSRAQAPLPPRGLWPPSPTSASPAPGRMEQVPWAPGRQRDSTARAPCSRQGSWPLPGHKLASGLEENHSREHEPRGPAPSPGRRGRSPLVQCPCSPPPQALSGGTGGTPEERVLARARGRSGGAHRSGHREAACAGARGEHAARAQVGALTW